MSIKSFKTQTAQDLFLGDNTKAARKVARHAWNGAMRRLSLLDGSTRLSELGTVPGMRRMPLKQEQHERSRQLYYSIRINDQYRITFRYEDGNAYDVDVEEARHHT